MKQKLKLAFLTALAVACLAFPLLLSSGCGKLPPIKWPQLVECAPGVSDLVGIVSRILIADGPGVSVMSDRAKNEMTQLGQQHGPGTVACVLERIVTDLTSPGRAMAPEQVAAAARGRAFLAEVGTVAHLAPDSQPEQW